MKQSHDALVEALEVAKECIHKLAPLSGENFNLMINIRAALALAKGGA
jgi:hypothetical protein